MTAQLVILLALVVGFGVGLVVGGVSGRAGEAVFRHRLVAKGVRAELERRGHHMPHNTSPVHRIAVTPQHHITATQ